MKDNNKGGVSRRQFLGSAVGAGAGVGAAIAGLEPTRAEAGAASDAATAAAFGQDVLLHDGRIHTLDAHGTVATGLLVRDGRILQVIRKGEAARASRDVRRIDLRGHVVVPGLIDSHCHALEIAKRCGWHCPRVESTTSIRELQAVLAAFAKDVPAGQWITAMGGWHVNQWAERRLPTLQELDAALPGHPVFLFERFFGVAVTNSLGKKFFDEADAGPLPHPAYHKVGVSPAGAIEASSSTAGGASTSALFLLRRLQVQADTLRNARIAMDYSTSLGLTTWFDKGTLYSLGDLHPNQGLAGLDPYRVFDPWHALNRQGKLTVRVQYDFTISDPDPELPMLREYLKIQLPFFGDDMLRAGSVGEWAAPLLSGEPWRRAQWLMAEKGWRNDNTAGNAAAVAQVVDEYERVARVHDIAAMRWTMNLITKDVDRATLERLNKLGVAVQVCINNWVTSANPKEIVGPYFRTILDSGIRCVMFSNAGHIAPLNPWLHIQYAVTGLNCLGDQVNPGQQLTRAEALRLYSSEKAWYLHMEDRLGTLEPGKYADLAVLDRDYFAVPDAGIRDIKSVLTMVGGQVVHEAPGALAG